MAVVGVWAVAFPDLRDIDSFDDVAGPDRPEPLDEAEITASPLLEHEPP
jgi:hypothetical protein